MRHFSSSHGKHCYLRSFQTKCLKCGVKVLYWECTHGSKLFFEYPPYGKLIRHRCRKPMDNKLPNVTVIYPATMIGESIPSCPICGKTFKSEPSLNDHILQLKKIDQEHKNFFKNHLSFNENVDEATQKLDKSQGSHYKAQFGRINIKKKELRNS